MPLLYIKLVECRTPEQVESLLDAIHAAVVAASATATWARATAWPSAGPR
ncbi:hypothetical protein AB0L13_47135 [Saccharopolyspora shandongensis]